MGVDFKGILVNSDEVCIITDPGVFCDGLNVTRNTLVILSGHSLSLYLCKYILYNGNIT